MSVDERGNILADSVPANVLRAARHLTEWADGKWAYEDASGIVQEVEQTTEALARRFERDGYIDKADRFRLRVQEALTPISQFNADNPIRWAELGRGIKETNSRGRRVQIIQRERVERQIITLWEGRDQLPIEGAKPALDASALAALLRDWAKPLASEQDYIDAAAEPIVLDVALFTVLPEGALGGENFSPVALLPEDTRPDLKRGETIASKAVSNGLRQLDHVVPSANAALPPAEQHAAPPVHTSGPSAKGKPQTRSWTQRDLDEAIRKYKADRASSYGALCDALKTNSEGAKKKAMETYGRNVIARTLGVKSPAMVSKAPAWIAIAKELGIPLHRDRRSQGTRCTRRPGRVGHEIAVEEKSQRPNDCGDNLPADEKLESSERLETLRCISRLAQAGKTPSKREMNRQAADELAQKLRRGECSDEQAREVVRMALEQV